MRTPLEPISARRVPTWRIALGALIVLVAVGFVIHNSATDDSKVVRRGTVGEHRVGDVQLAGGVRGGAGEPVAVANVCAYGVLSTTKLDRYCATTDGQGHYGLMLAPGQYSVTASAENHASATSSVIVDAAHEARLDFTLDRQAPTIAGIVNSAAGVRISAARVAVYQGTSLVSNVSTNDKGGFTAWTPSGELVVRVEAEGFGSAVVRTVAPTMDVMVTLYPGNEVSGRVLLDGSLQPVPNVHVTAVSGADRIVSELRDSAVQTDAQGNFAFPNLPAGTWTLAVADRHVWGMSPIPLVVTSGKSERDVVLLVQPAGEIAGRFVLSDNAQPCPSGRMQLIPEAMVRKAALHPEGEIPPDEPEAGKPAPVPVLTAVTGENGVIRFDAIPYGIYRVGPICDQHQLASGPTTLEIGGDTTEQLWKFSAGAGLSVRVVDEAGRPIANAALVMSLQSQQGLSRGQLVMSQRNGMTDAQGNYRFGALLPSQYQVSARYSALNGKAMVSELVDLQGGEPSAVTLTLPGAGKLRIHAHTPTGASISRVLFFAVDSQGARYEGAYGGDGRFVIGPLPRDSYRVYGYDNKNAKLPLNNNSPIPINGSEPVDIDFIYDAPTAFLQGRVVDSNGKPIQGVYVRAVSATLDEDDERYSGIQVALHGGQEQMTDQSGLFRIEGLKNQALYDIYLDHPSGVKEQRSGVMPGAFLDVAFPATAMLIGTVIDASGKPVNEFDVVYNSFANHDTRSQSYTKSGGRFKVENVYPGSMQVSIYSADGDLRAARELTVAAGQVLNVGQFVLASATSNETTTQ